MVISSITGVNAPIQIAETQTIDSSVVRQIEDRKSEKEIGSDLSTESYVRQYFDDIPIMIAIAKCESHFRQLNSDGNIHRGMTNKSDVGVMQINEFYHLKESQKSQYDIYTLDGNVSYARQLYEKQGTGPWNSSKSCWGKYQKKDLAINTK